jgi:CheY-like chemotaxis protein
MVSSKSNPVDKQWAQKLGATDYIVKPYTEADVLQQIAKL